MLPILQLRKLKLRDGMKQLSIDRAKMLPQRLSQFPGSGSQVSFLHSPVASACGVSVMSNCSHTLCKILWVFLYSIPSRVYYITKSYHALSWLIQYRNWFLSEMTVVILKQRKNLVLFSRTVIALTQSNEYLILKQNPHVHFIFQGTEIWRGKLFERFSVHPLLESMNACQVENV